MSGICGRFNRDGTPLEPDALDAPMAAMGPYGRDGSGVWQDGSVGLGHQMTFVTPESLHERLPLAHEASSCVITGDIRLDNRAELLRLLELGPESVEISDSSIVLAAYLRWGADCPPKLLGDFAFAIWDQREQRCLRRGMLSGPNRFTTQRPITAFASPLV